MTRSRLSRGRGPRIRDDELARMLELYQQGRSIKAIAKEVHRHWQTVRKYTLKELQERRGEELRREALKEALIEHYRDLAKALQSLPVLLKIPLEVSYRTTTLWQPPAPDRRNQLLLDALRESHIKESRLWSWWDGWSQAAKAYDERLQTLRTRARGEVARLERSSRVGRGAISERLAEVLFLRGVSIARNAPIYGPTEFRVRPSEEPGEEADVERLMLEEAVIAKGHDMDRLMKRLAQVMGRMSTWDEVKQLAGLRSQMSEIEAKISEEVEVLSLRRAFPGRCRLCPV